MLLQNVEKSLADDNTSVNEDDVYEDDWEEEPEEDKDSKEESKDGDDIQQESIEKMPHVSGNPFALPSVQALNMVNCGHISMLSFGEIFWPLLLLASVH
jgi:hypothetical protein